MEYSFHSVILSQFFGLSMVITSIIVLARADFYRAMVSSTKADSGVLFFSSFCGLLLGIFLVDIHNLWGSHFSTLITVLCWMVLVRAIIWLSFPEMALAYFKKLFAGPLFYVLYTVMFLIGTVLISAGFYHFPTL